MKQFLALLAAAAFGSAATVAVISVRSHSKNEDKAVVAKTEAAPSAPIVKSESPTPFEKPAGEARDPGQKGGRFAGRNGGAPGGGMFADVEGVPAETMGKIRIAAFKAMQSSEAVKTARNRLAELGKQAEYASDQEKMTMRQDFEYAMEDMRKAIHQAITEADSSIPAEAIDKVLDAMAERRKSMGMQGKKK